MAEDAARNAQFEYKQLASLVLQPDRNLIDHHRSRNEATGEVLSLNNRLEGQRMGERAGRERPQELEDRKAKRAKKAEEKARESRTQPNLFQSAAFAKLNLRYRPKTRETQRVYETILSYVTELLGSQPTDILCGAADEILEILKDEASKTKEKHKELESLLGKLSEDKFTQFIALAKRITDFGTDESQEAEEGGMDEELGVALVFDKEDDDVEEGDDEDEVRDVVEDDLEGGEEAAYDSELRTRDGLGENVVSADHIDARSVDAYWLQRELSKYWSDAVESQTMANSVLSALQDSKDDRDCENKLVSVLGYDKFDFVKLLRANRNLVLYATKLARAQDEERVQIEAQMRADPELEKLLTRIREGEGDGAEETARLRKAAARQEKLDADLDVDVTQVEAAQRSKQVLKLEDIAFHQGGHLMANRECKLPPGTVRKPGKGYEEVIIPAAKERPYEENERLVQISSMPSWAQPAFEGFTALNRVQSRLFNYAMKTDGNLLLCAPTGSGKTNVALLTMLQLIGKHVNEDGSINLDKFKIIYIAPMKSLVQEMVGSFGKRLKPFGIKVDELTGDHQLSKEQIAETQLIICTPEKWDIITRKASGGLSSLVSLVIIDEIHLLHDDRGPVLESIVARTIRQIEATSDHVRLVGLSATLPNYEDVAEFLHVDVDKGLFFFDGSFRAVPLHQTFIGISEKKAVKRLQIMNDLVYERVMKNAGTEKQSLVFTHSRKDTVKTMKTIRDMCLEKDTLGSFVQEDTATSEILRQAAEEQARNADLKELLPYGFAVHHAGLQRTDRTLVEDLFANGHIKVLVSTATLAWGVNLPAHTVIIKGTQIYSPEKGQWVELSALDVMQMIGRAGRPQYGTAGEGILITTHGELQYYLSLQNEQLPVESQYVGKLPDNLNAEIVAGTIQSVKDAVDWLGYTYLYVRMMKNPMLYGISREAVINDPQLERRRADLIHTAALVLEKAALIKYNPRLGQLQATDLGRIASHYYCTNETMATYNTLLKPSMTEIELLRVFSRSSEFKFVNVREEEKLELTKLLENVPIPIKESIDEPSAKVNALLQSYISQLKLDGFALVADMVFVTQSAGRLLRAMYEVVLQKGWAQLTERLLSLCKMVDKRMWQSMTPLRQFKRMNDQLIKKIEKKEFLWERLYDLSPTDLGELIKLPKDGKKLHRLIHQFPRLHITASIQPITRSTLKVVLNITPDFQWDETVHGKVEAFWIFIQDADGEKLLHHEYFLLKEKFCTEEHQLNFFIEITEPLPPQYFIRVVSDRWVGSEVQLPVSFRHLLLPEKFPPHTELLDLRPLPLEALQNAAFEGIYRGRFEKFNSIQTQVFNALYQTDENVFVGAPNGSGKTVCAEFAMLRAFSRNPKARCVYIAPLQDLCDLRYSEWRETFGKQLGKQVVLLTGDTTADLKLLAAGNVVIATPEQWDVLSRRWLTRKNVREVAVFIADELHLVGARNGPVYEIVCSRMRTIAAQDKGIRTVALAAPIANANNIAKWLTVPAANTFNYSLGARPVSMDLHIQGFNIANAQARVTAMGRPALTAIKQYAPDKSVLLFVPSRRQAQVTALELTTQVSNEGAADRFLHCSEEELAPVLAKVKDEVLVTLLRRGVAYYHAGMGDAERRLVEHLFNLGAIQVCVVAKGMEWALRLNAHLVVVMDTQAYDGREHRYVDYAFPDILQMIGLCGNPRRAEPGVAIIMCLTSKKDFFKKFLNEPLPVESHLDHMIHDHFNAEIVSRMIKNKQHAVDYLTWTFLYVRMTHNPNYYSLQGTTNRHLSDHLSELVENTLTELEEAKCISIDEDNDSLSPLNLGTIAAFYYINYSTIEIFGRALTNATKLKGLLEIITTAVEFDDLPVRQQEDRLLQQLAGRLPYKQKPTARFNDPHVKANILLQAYFSRISVPAEMQFDQETILKKVPRLIQAVVDVLASSSWLEPALAAMELAQMVTQAVWPTDSHLKQLPHITKEALQRASAKGVETIFDLTDLEASDRNELLGMSAPQMADVALFCNRYPSIELSFEVESPEDVTSGSPVKVHVQLARDGDKAAVIAPFYPGRKDEGWWLAIARPGKNSLASIKRVVFDRELSVDLEFDAPEADTHDFKLYFMCDSFVGCDQEYDFQLVVKPGAQNSEENGDDAMET
eukprot:m.207381 g.207381  ORF g.207381 m.207381 type:complete len:2142 (+) comp17788_c0_seq1:161-6586(+)